MASAQYSAGEEKRARSAAEAEVFALRSAAETAKALVESERARCDRLAADYERLRDRGLAGAGQDRGGSDLSGSGDDGGSDDGDDVEASGPRGAARQTAGAVAAAEARAEAAEEELRKAQTKAHVLEQRAEEWERRVDASTAAAEDSADRCARLERENKRLVEKQRRATQQAMAATGRGYAADACGGAQAR